MADQKSALTKALENEKGSERPTVYKGLYLYADQYTKLIKMSSQNKISGSGPASISDIVRTALDEYFKALSN